MSHKTSTTLLGVSLSVLAIASAGVASHAQAQSAPAQTSAQTSATAPAPAATPAPAPATAPATTPAPANATGDDDGPITTVTVTAAKPLVEHKIDRDVYDVKQDPLAATGSAADVLNNVPAVTVDPDGTVGLRGNTGVQVYVNGKPSAQMKGDNRAFTLQSLAADDIDTIEVMTNPPASFGSDSSAGIINIVMKRGRSIKPQTGINATAGDEGRGRLGLRTGKVFGKLTLNGSLNVSHNGSGGGQNGGGGGGLKSHSFSDRYRLDPTTGLVTREDVSNTTSQTHSDSMQANINGTYNLNQNDEIDGQLGYSTRSSTSLSDGETTSYDATHNVIGQTSRFSNVSRPNTDLNFSLTYDHRGAIGTSEDFKMQLTHSNSNSDRETLNRNVTEQPLLTAGTTYQAQSRKTSDSVDDFSGDWSHPIGTDDNNQKQVQLGWDIQDTISNNYNYQSLSLSTPVTPPNAPRTSSVSFFHDYERLSAAYGIYQQQIGKFGYEVGLRIEDLQQDIRVYNPTLSAPPTLSSHDTINYSPSLYLTYKVSDTDQAKLVYTQKIQRPGAQQLNPLVVFSEDGLNANSGNSALKPAQTSKYEADYNGAIHWFNYSVSLFDDATTGAINNVSYYLPNQPSVLLSTYENFGKEDRTGATLNLNGAPSSMFHFSVNGTYAYRVSQGIDPATQLLTRTSGPTSSGGMQMTFKPGAGLDAYNLQVQYRGKQTSTQGYSTGYTTYGLSYTHQLIQNKFVLTVNAQDVLESQEVKRYTNTSTTRGFTDQFDPGYSVMVSLRYTFGQVINGQRQRGEFRGPRPDGQQGGRGGGYGGGRGGGGGGGFGGGGGGF